MSVPTTVPVTVRVTASLCRLLSRRLPLAFSHAVRVSVAPAASVALANPTVSALRQWWTLLTAVSRRVSVHVPAAWGEQVIGTFAQVERCVTAATRVVLLTAVRAGAVAAHRPRLSRRGAGHRRGVADAVVSPCVAVSQRTARPLHVATEAGVWCQSESWLRFERRRVFGLLDALQVLAHGTRFMRALRLERPLAVAADATGDRDSSRLEASRLERHHG
jgi:hypothetical protein